MYAITGATGQLGRLVLDALLKTVPAADIVACVRDPNKADDLRSQGLQVRLADYDRPETLTAAFEGVDKLLLISSSEIGRRVPQHRAVIEAAKGRRVDLIVYTSLLHADTSRLGLAEEHRQTEALIRSSSLPFVILRNGWYTENYMASVPAALTHGALLGSAGEGRIASAARADYAAAAAAALTSTRDLRGRVFELAGDKAYTLAELAAELSRQSGQPVSYNNLPRTEYEGVLLGAGLPTGLAALLAESDAVAAEGGLFDDGGELATLTGRPTTPLAASVTQALAAR